MAAHLEKLAVVYVCQSSPKQVLENRESRERQYAFADQAVAFGWPRERVLTIDEDLGKSGRTVEGRDGFQRLTTEVTLNHVGLVLGLEMSRLARSSKDWHDFFEMCAIFGTLIADEDGVYDANDPNDRLLLGLQGIMSEMELHIMRNRLIRGRDNKAQRGEPFHRVPMGYVILSTGEVDFDPDEQAREAGSTDTSRPATLVQGERCREVSVCAAQEVPPNVTRPTSCPPPRPLPAWRRPAPPRSPDGCRRYSLQQIRLKWVRQAED